MNRLMLLIFLGMVQWLVGAQAYHTYDMEPVMQFLVGAKPDFFKIDFHQDYPNGPTAMAFDEKGELFISDPLNQRVLVLNKEMGYEAEFPHLFSDNVSPIFYAQNGYLFYSVSNRFFFDKLENGIYEKKFSIDLNKSKFHYNLDAETDYVFLGDSFFARLKDGNIIAIKNPGMDEDANNGSILEHDQALGLLKGMKQNGLSTDSKNRFFINGEIFTRNYIAFLEYWDSLHKERGMKQPIVDFSMRAEELSKTSTIFLGKDDEGNYYWNDNYVIIVFDKKGFVKDLFSPNITKKKAAPALAPTGDVYFLDYDSKVVSLFKIKRAW